MNFYRMSILPSDLINDMAVCSTHYFKKKAGDFEKLK